MRFLLPDPLGNNRHPQMFHSSAFAIAAGVVAVGAAAGSAAISMSAADRAKKAQGAASARYQKGMKSATSTYEENLAGVGKMIKGISAPQYNLDQEEEIQKVVSYKRVKGKGGKIRKVKQVKDVVVKKPSMIGDARKISDYYRQQLETFQPGAAQQRQQAQTQIGEAMDVVSSYLRGDIPQDVKDQITRNVAESAGAGFSPATAGRTGGFQAAQGQLARNLGLTSLDIQGRGLAAMPSIQGTAQNWQQLAKSFTAEPLDVGRLQLGYQTAQAEVGLQKAKMTSDMFGNLYNAQSGLATQIYGANKENIAASYAAQQAVGQGVSQIGQATSGALMTGMQISAAKQGLNLGGMGGMGGDAGAGATPQSMAGYGNKQYIPATSASGGQYYKPVTPLY